MKLSHIERRTGGEIHFLQDEEFSGQRAEFAKRHFTIALNTGPDQEIFIDNISCLFPSQSLLPLFSNQTFSFENSRSITAWQYNRDFYCIVDHDNEVSGAGFLFFGTYGNLFIKLDESNQRKLDLLRSVFIEEFETAGSTQSE